MTSSPDEPRVAGSAAARTEGLASVLSPDSPAIAQHPARVVRAAAMPADTPHVPAVIVGGGACGMTAGIRLRDAGVDCVVLERDAVPSGSTALSSGFIPAAETRLQKSLGIPDSLALFRREIEVKSHGQAAPHLVVAYTEGVRQAIDALEAHGITFEVADTWLYPGHSVHRIHCVPERTGAALLAALGRVAAARGVDVLTEALVREIWVDDSSADDRIVGVGYQRPDGTVERLACDALILACNGYGGNPGLVRELLPAMAEASFGGHVGNDGSAIAWGRRLGARLADLGGYQGHGSWIIPQGALMTWAAMMEGGVQINAQGQRFHNENHGYSEAAVEVLAQPGGIAWNVFDTPVLDLLQTFPDFVEAQANGALRSFADEAGLAAHIGCDETALRATLAAIEPGVPDRFGRTFKRKLAAPLHAVKVTGSLFHTQGGLDIDEQCRVLREDGTPLPNLLAAGGAARGVSGNEVWGYLTGNGLLSAVGGGWLAGGTVAAMLAQESSS
jgi:fumarate reductase flavoprotein subunit